MTPATTVLVTGASTGIGATCAERFAQRGHGLVPVARDRAGRSAVEARLRNDRRIGTGGATKACVPFLSPGRLLGLSSRGVYEQTVLPASTPAPCPT